MRPVQIEVECVRVRTYRATNEFCSWLSILSIWFYETVHAHIRLERGLDTIEVVHRDPGKCFHGYAVLGVSLVQRLHSWFQSTTFTSSMQGQTSEETQVVTVPLGMDRLLFQSDDGFVPLDVDWKVGHSYTSYRVIDDAIDEKCDIGHEFAHPRRIRSLIDGPLQDVGFSDAFEELIKLLAVGDETGLVQVASTAVARGMVVLVLTRVLVPQNEPVTEVNLECVGLFLEHVLQRRL